MKPELLAQINKRTPEEVRRIHQQWIDHRDKNTEKLAKDIAKRLRKGESK